MLLPRLTLLLEDAFSFVCFALHRYVEHGEAQSAWRGEGGRGEGQQQLAAAKE